MRALLLASFFESKRSWYQPERAEEKERKQRGKLIQYGDRRRARGRKQTKGGSSPAHLGHLPADELQWKMTRGILDVGRRKDWSADDGEGGREGEEGERTRKTELTLRAMGRELEESDRTSELGGLWLKGLRSRLGAEGV